MSLLRRRMMMGEKQADFPLVEVENISTWTASVTDDARNYGWTLEKPYHLGFTSLQSNLFVHMLTDSDFLCMDVPDNDGAILVDRNLFIPEIGFWYMSGISTDYATNITAQSVKNGDHSVQNTYTVTTIFDSIGRKWSKVAVSGMYSATIHRRVFTRSADMPVYYCVENDLGKVFPERRWDKHYYVYPDVKVVLRTDIVTERVSWYDAFAGLQTVENRAVVLSDYETQFPAYLGNDLKGYLIQIPDELEQMELSFNGSGAFIVFYKARGNYAAQVQSTGRVSDSYTFTNASTVQYVVIILDTTSDPSYAPPVSVVGWSEW